VSDIESLTRELADQRALERLTEDYAHATDRREAASAASLFTEDGLLTLFMDGPSAAPTRQHCGRPAIAAAIASVSRYDVTTHFLGQRSFDVDGDQARGETYCLACHLRRKPGLLVNVLLSVRYLDSCVRSDGRWLFRERRLIADWTGRSEHSAGRGGEPEQPAT
jgi:ketosteroid isomerase-like protein